MFTSILDSVFNEPSIAPYVEKCKDFAASLGDLFPYAVIALCLIVGMFGRRLSGLIRVSLLFAIGFVASVHWVAPFVVKFVPDLPALYVGLAAGVIAAVLSKMIYNLTYIGCIGFDAFNICYGALFLPELTSTTQGDSTLSLVVAIFAVFIALGVRKYLEMIITAVAGGLGIAYFVKTLYDYTTYLNYDPNVTLILATAIVAAPLFVFQYRNRGYYYY